MTDEQHYHSILYKSNTLPIDYLPQVNELLSQLDKEVKEKAENKQKLLSFTGAW
jgi:hypothetical protein